MSKKLIGFTGERGTGKTTAAKVFKAKGFSLISFNDKVGEFASYLFPEASLEDDSEGILFEVRKRGYAVRKDYWINLVLSTLPDNKELFVFDDIWPFEGGGVIDTFQITRPEYTDEVVTELTTIKNDGTIKEFTENIEKLYNDIVAKS